MEGEMPHSEEEQNAAEEAENKKEEEQIIVPLEKHLADLKETHGLLSSKKIPLVDSKEDMFRLLSDIHYSHNPDEKSGISKLPYDEKIFSLNCNMGSAAIASNKSEEQLQEWYDEFYKDDQETEEEIE